MIHICTLFRLPYKSH